MANFMADQLKIKSVFVVDDSGAYGVGLADAFQAQATKRGMTVLGRDRVDPLTSDYRPLLTKIKNLDAQAMYCGSSALAGVKLVKQSYDIMPDMIKAGGDGMHQPSILSGAGFPAAQGWYSTIAAPHMLDEAKLSAWLAKLSRSAGAPNRRITRSPPMTRRWSCWRRSRRWRNPARRWPARRCAMPSRPARLTRCRDRCHSTPTAT